MALVSPLLLPATPSLLPPPPSRPTPLSLQLLAVPLVPGACGGHAASGHRHAVHPRHPRPSEQQVGDLRLGSLGSRAGQLGRQGRQPRLGNVRRAKNWLHTSALAAAAPGCPKEVSEERGRRVGQLSPAPHVAPSTCALLRRVSLLCVSPRVCFWGTLPADGRAVPSLSLPADAPMSCTLPSPLPTRPSCRSFHGTLPKDWGDVDTFSSLQNVYLNDNNLTGSLPEVGGRVARVGRVSCAHWRCQLAGACLHGRYACPHSPPANNPAAHCKVGCFLVPAKCTKGCLAPWHGHTAPSPSRCPPPSQEWGGPGALPSLLQLRLDSNRL